MVDRGGLSYILLGAAAPLALLIGNLMWNLGGLLVTIFCLLWIGFGLTMLHPPED